MTIRVMSVKNVLRGHLSTKICFLSNLKIGILIKRVSTTFYKLKTHTLPLVYGLKGYKSYKTEGRYRGDLF